jgi:thiol-disulfide isomerase/thioredoxin
MKKIYSVILYFIFVSLGFSQTEEVTFGNALRANLKKYNIKSNIAFENYEIVKGQMLFDSLVTNHLKGTTFEDFTVRNIKKGKVKLSSYKKPLFILTYASWCIPNIGEIPALNKLAEKYAKDVQFVVLFWDKKKDVRKVAKKFNHNISVCYSHESYKNDAPIVANLKHTLGFPTSYFIDQNLKVVDIKRASAQIDMKNNSYVKSYAMNYNTFRSGLGSLLVNKNISDEQLTTN